MKRWRRCCASLVVLGWWSGASATTLTKGPYLQNLTTDAVTVMWETDAPEAGLVEYGPTGQLTRRAEARSARRIQEVRLTGLRPETAYRYRVVVGQAKAGPFDFRTAVRRETPYRFAVYGDNRSNPKVHGAIVEAMAKHRPAFILNTGDLVGDGDKYEEWGPQYFAPLAKLHCSVPVYPAIGNHERSGKLYLQFFSLPDPEWYYAFGYGNAKFVMMDSNYRKPNWLGPDSEQGRWLVRELKDRGHTWTFAGFHHPPYSSHPRRGGSRTHRRLLCPSLEAHGVDVVFNGHNHNYERIFPMRGSARDDVRGVHYVITGGGGASTYAVEGDWFTAAYERVHHYCIVDVDGPVMTMTVHTVDGRVIDRFGLCRDPTRLARLAKRADSATGKARVKAVDRLSVIFSPKTPDLLAGFAADKDVAVRRSVAAGLGRLAMAGGRTIALKMLNDPDAAVRRGAALAVARTSSLAEVDVVMRLLKDPDAAVRRNAAWFFIHVRGPGAIRHVLMAMDDQDADVRRLAIRGVKGVKDTSVRPILAKAIVDDDADVALRAADMALHRRHAAALIGPLTKAARHKDPRVRHAAIKALVATGKRDRIIPVLIEAVADKDQRVQGYALGALERLAKKTYGYDQAKWKKWWAEQKR